MRRCVGAFLFFSFLLAGCAHDPDMDLYGNWEGGFTSEKPGLDLTGYLQIYATGHKFKMHVGTSHQSFDPSGTWQLKGRQVLLSISSVDASGIPESDAAVRHVLYVHPDSVRAAYGQELILNLSADRKTLDGLPVTIDDFEGRHQFKKQELSHYR